jgi:hypothetical protein
MSVSTVQEPAMSQWIATDYHSVSHKSNGQPGEPETPARVKNKNEPLHPCFLPEKK